MILGNSSPVGGGQFLGRDSVVSQEQTGLSSWANGCLCPEGGDWVGRMAKKVNQGRVRQLKETKELKPMRKRRA